MGDRERADRGTLGTHVGSALELGVGLARERQPSDRLAAGRALADALALTGHRPLIGKRAATEESAAGVGTPTLPEGIDGVG